MRPGRSAESAGTLCGSRRASEPRCHQTGRELRAISPPSAPARPYLAALAARTCTWAGGGAWGGAAAPSCTFAPSSPFGTSASNY